MICGLTLHHHNISCECENSLLRVTRTAADGFKPQENTVSCFMEGFSRSKEPQWAPQPQIGEGGRGTNEKSVDGQLPHPCTCCLSATTHSVDISRNRAQDEPKASRRVCQGATLYLEAQLWVIVAGSSRTSASLKPNAARHEYMF